MATAFPQIFLDFHPSRKFIMHVSINGISWKITLDKMICICSVLHLSEKILLLGLFPLTFLFVTYSSDSKLNTLTTVYSSLDHPTFSVKVQEPIYNLGPHPYSILSTKKKKKKGMKKKLKNQNNFFPQKRGGDEKKIKN